MLRREFVALIRETLAGAQFLRWLINKELAQRTPPPNTTKSGSRAGLRDAVNRIIYSKQDQRPDSLKSQTAQNPPTGISVTYVKCKLVQGPGSKDSRQGQEGAKASKAVTRAGMRFV